MRTARGWGLCHSQSPSHSTASSAAPRVRRSAASHPKAHRPRYMAESVQRPMYGARCAALGNGSEPQTSARGSSNGDGEIEAQHPGGSMDLDCTSICSHDECPFPLHDAFSPERKERRLRNQVRVEQHPCCALQGGVQTAENGHLQLQTVCDACLSTHSPPSRTFCAMNAAGAAELLCRRHRRRPARPAALH
jgi:hypothetical protein